MSTSDRDRIAISATRNSAFLNNLEQWIDEVISQDGLADTELIKTIKERFEHSIQANIEHHRFMMKNANENNEKERADRHRLMAEVYQSILK